MVKTTELFSLDKSLAGAYLLKCEYPFELLPKIKDMILEIGKSLSKEEYNEISENVWVHKTAKVAPCLLYTSPSPRD